MPKKRLPTVPDPDQPALPKAVTSSVGFLCGQVAALFRARFEEDVREHRLHPRQFLLLMVLRDEGTMPQQAVGQRLGMDRTTTMQAALGLADAGYVERQDDPDDRRVYQLALTPNGRRLVATLEGRMKRVESELLAPLAVNERAVFAQQLRAVLAAAGEATDCDGR
jgi:DNA-binding MarR family transcriptional regulator